MVLFKKKKPKPLSLGQKQREFPKLLSKLINFAYKKGFEISLGEAWRPPETAKLYAMQGKGIKNSLHTQKLAIDLNLFKNGVYLSKTEDHRVLGKYWESLGTPGVVTAWGGRFGDGNHYSIKFRGRA